MVNSRQKGKRGELEAAALLRSHGIEARRGQQFKGGENSPDVVCGLEGVHLEIKRVEALNIYAAFEQAERDAGIGQTPVVLHRRNGKPWLAVLSAADAISLLKRSRGLE